MKAAKKTRPQAGFLTKLVILVLLAAIGWQLYNLQGQLADAQAEKERYAALVAAKEQENTALETDIANGPTAEKLQEIARDELGLVKPGEYVFDPNN